MDPYFSWYAVRTKPRQEDRAVENLAYWGIDTLAPKLRGKSGRTDSHLFPGYIFARFDGTRMLHKIHFTRGVSYVLSFGGVPAVISDEIIAEIHARIDTHGMVNNVAVLKPGDKVIIKSGVLRDFVGVFDRDVPGTERVQILLRSVAYSAHAEVSRYEVAKLAA